MRNNFLYISFVSVFQIIIVPSWPAEAKNRLLACPSKPWRSREGPDKHRPGGRLEK